MKAATGKRSEPSRQRLAQALLKVMAQYRYQEITITQIAQEAHLSRKTFYRLFTSKDEVLSLIFDNLFQACFARVKARNPAHYWDVMQAFFDFWEERRELLLLLQKSDLLPRVFEQSYQRSIEVFTFVHSEETAAFLALPLPYLLAYSVGGMHSMMLKWVENGMEIPSSALIAMLKASFLSPET